MNIVLWILQIIVALAMLGSGGMKLVKSKDYLLENQSSMALMKDYSQGQIRGIGVLEVAGALGLILPWATGIAPILTPIAALGIAVLMVGAVAAHRKFGDPTSASVPAFVLAILSLIIAVGRGVG